MQAQGYSGAKNYFFCPHCNQSLWPSELAGATALQGMQRPGISTTQSMELF
jgi:hypothetical protein